MKDFPWQFCDWPLEDKQVITHLAAEDLRRWMWLLLYGKAATAQKAEDGGIDESNPNRFAQKWEDWMLPYAEALQTTFTQAMTTEPHAQAVPGAITVWYEDSFSSTISGIDFSQYQEGELVIENCQQITKNSIWDWNGTGTPTPSQEQWYKEYDDWRPGTPFLLTGCSDERNNGFYRVLSRRMSGSTLFLRACSNDGQPVSFFADNQGTMSCNFGGDWWTLRGMNGHETASSGYADEGPGNFFDNLEDATYQLGITNQWWTWKDQYHRYEGNARGPHDGRPPSGGPFAIDFNGDWIRGVNPYLYHCYDKNSHRYILKGDFDSLLFLYFAGWRADEFLSIQVDPKEQVPPYFFADKENVRWKYGGKVPIRKNQISNPARLGPVNQCLAQAWHTQQSGWVAIATHRQYLTSAIRAVGSGYMITYGDAPPLSILLSPRDWWEQLKFDTAIQNMVEYTVEQYGWMMPVDDDYKANWFAVNHPSWEASPPSVPYLLEYVLYDGDVQGRTYQQVYADNGLAAYRPDLDSSMPAYAELHDELWGENGSAIELILKKLGTDYYDWWYDSQTPFISERILKIRTIFLASENPEYWSFPCTIHGVECNNLLDVANVCWPIPAGTWRRTWKRTLGYIREGYMRDSELGDPALDEYENYSWEGPYSNNRLAMPGHHRFSAPAGNQYGGVNLAANHGPDFSASGREYYQKRIYQILNDCRLVLKSLSFFTASDESISFKMKSLDVPYTLTTYGQKDAETVIASYQEYLDTYWNDSSKYTIEDLPLDQTAQQQGNCGYKCAADYQTIIPPGWRNSESCGNLYCSILVESEEAANYDSDPVKFLLRIGCRCSLPSLAIDYNYQSPTYLGLTGFGTIEPPAYWLSPSIVSPLRYYHVWTDKQTLDRLEIKTLGNFSNGDYQSQYAWRCNTMTYVEPLIYSVNDGFIAAIDFEKYSSRIWRRLKEKADVYLIDIFGDDRNPPKYENAFWKLPMLVNQNAEAIPEELLDSFYSSDASDSDYHITAESVLMEDLEGIDSDEVKYVFDFGETELSNQQDKEQTSRVYDEPLLNGTEDDAASVYLDGWDEGTVWNCRLNTRDSAEARGNESNNYGEPTVEEAIALTRTVPIFPLRPIIHYEKLQINGVWYDHIWVDPPFAEGGTVQYRLSRFDASVIPPGWAIIFSFGEQKPSAPSGYPDGPNHFWLDSVYGVSQTSEFSYRIQCNRLGVGRGMWSLPSSDLIILLTISNPYGLSISLNGQPLTFTGGVWSGTMEYYQDFVISITNLPPPPYLGWSVSYPGGYYYSTSNPLSVRAFADMTITAYG